MLLMDEAKGRNVSTQMGLRIMETIGILMAAYEEQELTSMRSENAWMVCNVLDGISDSGIIRCC